MGPASYDFHTYCLFCLCEVDVGNRLPLHRHRPESDIRTLSDDTLRDVARIRGDPLGLAVIGRLEGINYLVGLAEEGRYHTLRLPYKFSPRRKAIFLS